MYQEVWNKIKAYDSIVIFGHVNPDGDCYGSQIGLRQAIKDNFKGKNVYAVGSGFPRLAPVVRGTRLRRRRGDRPIVSHRRRYV